MALKKLTNLNQMRRKHGYQSPFFFHGIQILYNPGREKFIPAVVGVLLHLVDVVLPQLESGILNDEQRATKAAGISVDPDLSMLGVVSHGYFREEEVCSTVVA